KDGPPIASYIWGDVIPNCTECHSATVTTQVTESHNEHLAHPTVDCTDCHAATSATSMGGQSTHIDQFVTLSAGGASYGGGVSVGDTNFGTCDSGACHDAAVDIAWDATPTNCTDCHYNTLEVNNFNGRDETASVIASAQYTGQGHGMANTPDKGCLDCHAMSTGHDFSAALNVSSNPFRLGTTGAPYAGTPDVFCMSSSAGCHASAPAADVVSHTDENMTAAKRTWPSWDPKCVDCHDPHGDAANLSMIQSDLFDAGSTTNGVPNASVAETVDFTVRGGIAAGSYADTSDGADSICQECHTATVSFLDNDTAVAVTGAHPASGLSPCTNCHKHDSAFEPSGCDSCHGNQAGSYWPAGATYPNTAGRHQAHIDALMNEASYGTDETGQKAMCDHCHNDPFGAGGGGHYESPTWTAPADVGSFNRIWDSAADSAGAAAAYNGTTDTCAGLDCHDNQTTAANFSWYASSTSACGMCHADVTIDTTHTAHTASTTNFGLTVTCDTCHYSTTWDSAAPGTGHRDGSWTFEFNYTVGSWGSVAYSGSWEAGTSGTCGTNTCHNDGRGGVAAIPGYTWGTTYDNCNTCHIDSPITSSHGEHLASTVDFGLAIGCPDCHGAAAQQQSTHIDSQVTLASYAASYNGGVAVGDTNFGSCLTNFCHNDGTGAAPSVPGYTWSTAYDDCNTCHTDNPSSGNHVTHLLTPYGPAADCGDCHAANNNNTTMSGQASHISGTVDFASATTFGNTTACETCHGGSTPSGSAKSYWSSTTGQWLTDGGYCESCHGDYTAAQIGGIDAPTRAGAVFDSAGHGKVTDTATWGGSNCADCHDEYDASHVNGSLGDNRLNTVNGNDYSTSVNDFCANSCHSLVVTAHFVSGGSSDDGNRCDLCHDPHGQSGHDAMIAAAIGSPAKTVVGFTDKTQRSSYVVVNPGAGNYGVCQVCHDPNEVIHFNQTTSDGATHFGAAVCTDCHDHTTTVAFEVSCGACHADAGSLPLAHNKHAETQSPGGVQISCDVCHGVGAETGSHPGHAAGITTVTATNITLLGQSSYVGSYGARPSWFSSTWGGPSFFGATSVSFTDTSDFTCDNVRCHGGESVVWNQTADAGASTYSDVCFNCHNITPATFQLPGGTLYQAVNAAANYVGPISGFSRGGHGDSNINNVAWFEDVAPASSVPLGCVACHDETTDHFPVDSADRYRVGTAAAAGGQTKVTTLCVSCHSEETDFHFVSSPKHPSDNFTIWGGGGTIDVFMSDGGMSVFTTHDPVASPSVGSHIDQFVDHWKLYGATGATDSDTSDDFVPRLPLGDSLDPVWNSDNTVGERVTCITCHNPHGTDLFVSGETPGSGSTVSQIPANKMLRLRDQDDELCGVCHR
ncbi:MAG: hypothetical protein P1S59_13665, partial [bacterium]|nr:hypothetical protein [bacterium]